MNSAVEIPAVHQQHVQSGDIALAVYCRGNTDNPTVVLVHGYPDCAAVWAAVAEQLAADYHVVTYDVRGAGHSGVPKQRTDYRLEKLAQDLKAVTDAVCPDQAFHLVAHDWGSLQSWESVTDPEFQHRIASYTAISGPCLDHAAHWLRARLRRPTPQHLWQLFAQLMCSWYIVLFHLPLLAPFMWRLGAALWPGLLARMEGVRVAPSATQKRDGINGIELYRANFMSSIARPRQRFSEVPVQLLVPARERFIIAAIYDDLQQWVPKLWRRELAAGHWALLSHPQQVASFVREFIRFVETGEQGPALQRARVQPGGGPYAGKLVVVTGAGSGIGRETLLDFAERGAVVVAADLNTAAAQRTVELAQLLGATAHAYTLDVSSGEQMETFACWVQDTLGVPDIVVNNAGIGMAGPVLDMTVAEWEKILGVNLWGALHGSRLFGRQMVDAAVPGQLVNVSSGLAFFPTRSTPAYATSKAAVQMFSECLRAELAEYSIGVSAIYPGVVDTGIVTRTRFVGTDEAEEGQLRSKVQRLYQLRNLRPQAVAAGVRRAVEKNLPEVRVGIEVHIIRWISRLLPGVGRRLARIDATP